MLEKLLLILKPHINFLSRFGGSLIYDFWGIFIRYSFHIITSIPNLKK